MHRNRIPQAWMTLGMSVLGVLMPAFVLGDQVRVVSWGVQVIPYVEAGTQFTASDIVTSGGHSLALKSDGTVEAWGNNRDGQSTVPGDLSDAVAIAAGVWHSLALKSDGTVIAWGSGVFGHTTVPADLSDVIAIAAGDHHSLAIQSDGRVLAWGRNSVGQSAVPEDLSDVIAIAAGETHSLALKSDGTVVAWGAGSPGIAGFGHHGQSDPPANLRNVIAIAASGHRSLALVREAPAISSALGIHLTDGLPALRLLGEASGQYVLEYTSELSAASQWTALPEIVLTNSADAVVDSTAATAAQRFYRARLLP